MSNEEFQSIVLQEFKGLRQDVSEFKKDVSEFKKDVSELKKDVSELKKDVSELKKDVSELKKDVSELKKDVSELKKRMDASEKKLDAVYNHAANLTEFRTEARDKLDKVIDDHKDIYEILGRHELCMNKFRRRLNEKESA